jgi:signal transduction histidine kinase
MTGSRRSLQGRVAFLAEASVLLGSGLALERVLPRLVRLADVDAQARLVEDLLEMSSVVTGRMRLAVQTVDLRALIEEVVDAVRPGAEAKGLRLHSLLESPGPAVSGDPDRLRQVVWNLLANAVKFTPRGGRVEITAQRVRSHAEVVVSDTGQGIHPDLLPYVFDRLRQGDSSTTRLRVFAESPGEGHGATFVVKLPLTVADVREQPLARREPTSLGGLSLGAYASWWLTTTPARWIWSWRCSARAEPTRRDVARWGRPCPWWCGGVPTCWYPISRCPRKTDIH